MKITYKIDFLPKPYFKTPHKEIGIKRKWSNTENDETKKLTSPIQPTIPKSPEYTPFKKENIHSL